MARNDVVNSNGSINYNTIGGFKDRLDGHDASLAQKAQQFVTVDIRNGYGFIGDGVANDTPAIQSALNYLSSVGGGKLLFPPNKTIYIQKAGTRSIWTWNLNIAYSRDYGLLVPSNVSIDFNGCTLLGDTSTTLNIIENLNADVKVTGDTNIEIKNVTINQQVNTDTFAGNALDSVAVCFQNIDTLVLDNVTVMNTYGYGIRIIQASNVEFRNKVHSIKCLGACVRLGWDNFPVKTSTVNLLISEDSSDRLDSKTPGNTLYVNNCQNLFIREFRQITNDDTRFHTLGTNMSNNNNNIYVGKVYSLDTAFKIQDYSSDGTNQPTNVHIGDLVAEGSAIDPIFHLQGFRTKIDNLRTKNINADFTMNNGKYTEIGSAYFDNCTFVLNGTLAKELHFGKLFLYNSSAKLLQNGGNDVVTIGHLTEKWDATTTTGSYFKFLDIQCRLLSIGTIVYKLDGSMTNVAWASGKAYTVNQYVSAGGNIYQCTTVGGGNSTNQPTGTLTTPTSYADGYAWKYVSAPQSGGILSASSVNKITQVGHITDLNNVTVGKVPITLSAGTSTTVNLSNNKVWRDSWLNGLEYDLIPQSLPAPSVTFYGNAYFSDSNGTNFVINHSTAAGTEQFYLVVKGYKHIG